MIYYSQLILSRKLHLYDVLDNQSGRNKLEAYVKGYKV